MKILDRSESGLSEVFGRLDSFKDDYKVFFCTGALTKKNKNNSDYLILNLYDYTGKRGNAYMHNFEIPDNFAEVLAGLKGSLVKIRYFLRGEFMTIDKFNIIEDESLEEEFKELMLGEKIDYSEEERKYISVEKKEAILGGIPDRFKLKEIDYFESYSNLFTSAYEFMFTVLHHMEKSLEGMYSKSDMYCVTVIVTKLYVEKQNNPQESSIGKIAMLLLKIKNKLSGEIYEEIKYAIEAIMYGEETYTLLTYALVKAIEFTEDMNEAKRKCESMKRGTSMEGWVRL